MEHVSLIPYENLVSIYPYLISEETKLFELVTGIATKLRLSGNMLRNINMRKWIVEFLRKFASHDNKMARVNSIHVTNSINLL